MMTNDEIKTALFSGSPVKYNGVVYKGVSGIIYRVRSGNVVVSAELLDPCDRSVTIALVSKIEKA